MPIDDGSVQQKLLEPPLVLEPTHDQVEDLLRRIKTRRFLWIVLSSVTFLLLAGTIVGTIFFMNAESPATPPASGEGSVRVWIRMPDPKSVAGPGPASAQTNLPEGTTVNVLIQSQNSETPDMREVESGIIRITDGLCPRKGSHATGPFEITVTVRPRIDTSYVRGPPGLDLEELGRQPANVYQELGRHFERMQGSDVTTEGKDRILRISKMYDCEA